MYLWLYIGLLKQLICVSNNSGGITGPVVVPGARVSLALAEVEDLNSRVATDIKTGRERGLHGRVYFTQLDLALESGGCLVPLWL